MRLKNRRDTLSVFGKISFLKSDGTSLPRTHSPPVKQLLLTSDKKRAFRLSVFSFCQDPCLQNAILWKAGQVKKPCNRTAV